MSRETLKTFRLIVPGIMIVAFFLPLLSLSIVPQPSSVFIGTYNALSNYLPESIFKLLLVVFFGALYYTLDIRNSFLRDTHTLIQVNIKTKLLAPFTNDPVLRPRFESFQKGGTLMHIFYGFIDNDESLKAKASNVYFNGLLWSSIADLQAISLISGIVYLLVFGIVLDYSIYVYAVIFVITTVIARFFLLPRITTKHIAYSNDQLEFITLNYLDKLKEKLNSIPL